MEFIKILLAALMFVQFAVADTLQRVPGHKFLVRDSGSTNKATLEVPSLSADYTMKLPTGMGSNGYVLKSNGTDATSWVNSLTNFSLTSPTIGDSITTTQIATPSTPSAGYNKIYTKSDNKLYVLDSSGVEKSAGGLSAWAASIPYAAGDIVHYSGNTYIAISAHTSGSTFEADVAAGGKWKLVNNPANGENLIKVGSNFEDNDVAGWTAVGCATVTTNFPACNGSGGAVFSAANGGRAKNAGTTDPAVVSSNPLNEVYSLNMATSGANAIGDMYISPKINIPIKYQTKTLTFKFDYKVMSGTVVQAGNNTNTLGVAIYDVTNNSWSQPTGVFSIDGAGIASGTWQVPSNTTAAQLAVYYINAAGGATSVYVDDFYLGPQATSMGTPITDWVSYTPTVATFTGGITNYTVSGKWKRIGDEIEIIGELLFSNPSAAFNGIYISLPSGLSIDTNKITLTTDTPVSHVARIKAAGAFFDGRTRFESNNFTRFSILTLHTVTNDASSGTDPLKQGTAGDISNTYPATFTTGDAISFRFKGPISGWSSSTIMSDSAATTVNTARAYIAADQTGVNPNNSAVKVLFDTASTTITRDKLGMFDATNKRMNIKVAGTYKVSAMITVAGTNVLNNRYYPLIYKNGSAILRGDDVTPAANARFTINVSETIDCVAGDYLEIYFYGVGNNSASTLTISGAESVSNFKVEQVQGPSQIAASDTVAVVASDSSGQAFGATGVQNALTFNTIERDTHGTFNGSTGVFTAPVSGLYRVDGMISAVKVTNYAAGEYWDILIGASSGVGAVSRAPFGTAANVIHNATLSRTFRLLAGQTLTFTKRATYAAGSPTIYNNASYCSIGITRVGNF